MCHVSWCEEDSDSEKPKQKPGELLVSNLPECQGTLGKGKKKSYIQATGVETYPPHRWDASSFHGNPTSMLLVPIYTPEWTGEKQRGVEFLV